MTVPYVSENTRSPFARLGRFLRIIQLVWFTVIRYKLFDLTHRRTPPPERARELDELHERHARWLLAKVLKLKGFFIKVLQLLGARKDILPTAYGKAFSRLHDHVGALPFDQLKGIVVEATGKPIEETFASFDEHAIASASLAQVHKATLRDGAQVALKIQYPGVARLFTTDVQNVGFAMRTISRVMKTGAFAHMFDLLGSLLILELDFVNERRNMERLRQTLGAEPNVIVPRTYPELSNGMVLVMEWVDGIKITDVEAIDRAGLDRRVVLERIIDLYLKQVFEFGFFHGDPHPGNLLVRPKPDGGGERVPEIVFLDFGLCHSLGRAFMIDLGRLVIAVFSGSREKIEEALTRLGFKTKKGGFDTLFEIAPVFFAFARDVAAGKKDSEIGFFTVRQAQLKNFIVQFPRDIFIMSRLFMLVSGLSGVYKQKVDLRMRIQPFMQTLVMAAMQAEQATASKASTAESPAAQDQGQAPG